MSVGDLTDPLVANDPISYPENNYDKYVLKVCGRESFFLKSSPFIQYKVCRITTVFF